MLGFLRTTLVMLAVGQAVQAIKAPTAVPIGELPLPLEPDPGNVFADELAGEMYGICTDKEVAAPNHCEGVVYGEYKGAADQIVPFSCAQDAKSPQCDKDKAKIKKCGNNMEATSRSQIRKDRGKEDAEHLRVSQIFDAKKKEFTSTLTAAQKSILDKYIVRLKRLKLFSATHAVMEESKRGWCSDHAYNNAAKILKLSVERGAPINCHLVTVWGGKGQIAGSNFDHDFLIIGDASKVPDKYHKIVGDGFPVIEIMRDEAAVKQFLKDLPHGAICDSWNAGFFQTHTNNRNQFYREGWHSIWAEKISLQFDLSGFPAEVKKFVNDALKDMGFANLHGKTASNLLAPVTNFFKAAVDAAIGRCWLPKREPLQQEVQPEADLPPSGKRYLTSA